MAILEHKVTSIGATIGTGNRLILISSTLGQLDSGCSVNLTKNESPFVAVKLVIGFILSSASFCVR